MGRFKTAWPQGLFLMALLTLGNADEHCEGEYCSATGASLLALKAETHTADLGKLFDEEEREFPINMTVNTSNATMDKDLEMILGENAMHDMEEMNAIPNPENSTGNGTHGMGELGRTLEFMMLKIVQLETVVELQQHEIHDLRSIVKEHLDVDHNDSTVNMAQMDAATRTKQAQETLKKVMHKQNHQREKRDFNPQVHQQQPEERRELLSKRQTPTDSGEPLVETGAGTQIFGRRRRRLFKAVAKAASSAGNAIGDTASSAVDAASDGTGLVGDALGDAYATAADQVTFVANTVIDSVEMAVDILIRGFSDWSAGCPDTRTPDMSVDGDGIRVDWGRQKCWVRLMGQTCNLFDFNFGSVNLQWPEPLKTVAGFGLMPIKSMFNLGHDLVSCATSGSALQVIKCLGMRLLQEVPPLSFLTRMSEMLTEFIEVFAQVAAAVVKQVLDDSASLVQQAAESKFPAAGQPPVVHHAGKSLAIKTHAQHRKQSSTRSKLPRQMSAMQQDAQSSKDDPDPQGSIALSVSDQEGNYATRLISQWNGRETDTSSCLAFAPKSKHGSQNQATKADWQGSSDDAFIPLEPFGVPCDNDWMKANWNKWQGYSFYTWEMSIEKCVTVTYSLGLQPVIAFVGGLNFELMPAPLAELDTVVCWPDKQPGGVDLSVLRSEIRSGGVMLFSRTLRLQKRFGSGTDFVDSNIFGAHESWRNPLGTAVGTHGVEDDRTVETMPRSLLEANQSRQASESRKAEKAELRWETDSEELYLASIEYGKHLGINKTSELRGKDVLKRMSSIQAAAGSGTDFHQLFSFKNPGMVAFQIQGLLEDNSLEIGMQINFGPFESPEKRIPLLNIVDQFTLVLGAMPWVSPSSKLKAIASLRDFGNHDVDSVVPEVPPPEVTPGSIIMLHSPERNRYVQINEHGDAGFSGPLDYETTIDEVGMPWEKFAVVDAGNGLIGLHNPKWNRFLSMNPQGDVYGSPHRSASDFPYDWTWQKFKVVYAGSGKIALHCPHQNRFLRMTSHTVDASGHRNQDDLPKDWLAEQFMVKRTTWLLKPGSVVAFHNAFHNRYLSLGSSEMYPSPARNFEDEFPEGWTHQKFTVVDAGNGQVALHNANFNRFWKMTDNADMIGSSRRSPHELPAPNVWTWERFAVVDVGGGQVAFHNPLHNRMVTLSNTDVFASSHMAPQDFPHGWTWQMFQVKKLGDTSLEPNDLPWSFS